MKYCKNNFWWNGVTFNGKDAPKIKLEIAKIFKPWKCEITKHFGTFVGVDGRKLLEESFLEGK